MYCMYWVVCLVCSCGHTDVVVYGSRFCIYCKKQKTEFGEAFDKLRKHQIYVECEAAPKECQVMEVSSAARFV